MSDLELTEVGVKARPEEVSRWEYGWWTCLFLCIIPFNKIPKTALFLSC
jgi:hypothetical protein